ncbi:alpha-ketoacid dehydrogenase subunit beta, partial [Shewanella sp. 11B5]
MAQMNMLHAINEALSIAMTADERMVIFGEDVGHFGGVFRATSGLQEQFGRDR